MNLGIAKPKLERISRTSPMTPDFTSSTSFSVCGMQAIHEGFAQKRAGLARGEDHRVGLESGQPHRLFDQHVLAGFCWP